MRAQRSLARRGRRVAGRDKAADVRGPRSLRAVACVLLTAIARRRKRPAEVIEELEHLQPYPDRLLDDLVERETVELAFITAIQLLSPNQCPRSRQTPRICSLEFPRVTVGRPAS